MARRRHRLNRRKSRKMFKRGARRVHKRNFITAMRGGIRA